MIKLLRILALFLIPVCVLVISNTSVLAQTPITYGQTVTGSISTTAEIDEFTFSGTIGDKITIRFARTSGTFLPYVELLNSSGTQITSSNSGLIDATLSATETLKIAIRDNDTTNTGDYSLSIQRVNNPTGGIALAFGQTVTGNIDSFAKVITYTITAEANDTLRIAYARLTQDTGSFDFNLELYDPAGDLVISSSDGLLETAAASAGTYSLLVADNSRDGTGTYELTLQRTNNPANVTAITFGDTLEGTIGTVTGSAAYSFSLSANDTVTLRYARVTNTSGTFEPYLDLYDSTGTRITSSSDGLLTQSVTASGTFYLLVSDYNRDGTGTYSLSIQRVNNPTGGIALAFGQTVTGNIDSFAKIITYTITAEANDTLRVAYARFTQSSGSFDFNLELYDPAGNLVMSSSDGLLETTATSAGTYSLLLTDYSRDGTGTYELTLQRSNNPAGPTDVLYDAVMEDSIGTVTQFKIYKVTALAQDVITFCSAVKQGTANFDVYVELFDTAGNRLISNIGSIKHTFTDSGTFYLFISDYNRDGTGIFKFTLIKSDIDCSTIDLVNPQVTLNTPKPEEVVEIGSLYNITWVSLDNFGVTWQELRLSTDSGISYPSVIATNLTGNVQSYEWSVPENSASTHTRIMITARDANGNEGIDSTEGDFFILNTTLPADAVNMTYQYDNENRLIQSSVNGTPEVTYTYDGAGNRLNLNAN